MSTCPRCGKERILVSSHDEVNSNSKVTYRQTICPDPNCQKKIEADLENDERKRVILKNEQEKRTLQRLALKKASS